MPKKINGTCKIFRDYFFHVNALFLLDGSLERDFYDFFLLLSGALRPLVHNLQE